MKLGNDPRSALVLTRLEQAVLGRFADGLGPAGELLRAQAAQARVVSRSHSGVGFVTRLDIPETLPGVPPEAARRLRVVHAAHPQLREPAEFLVEFKGGRLASIEAFCHAGMWPADDAGFTVGPGSAG